MPKILVSLQWGADARTEATPGAAPPQSARGDVFVLIDIRNGRVEVVHESSDPSMGAGDYLCRTQRVRTYGVRKVVTRGLLDQLAPDALQRWDAQTGRLLRA